MRKIIPVFFLCLAVFLLSSPVARAYIIPPEQIFGFMAKSLGRIRGLEVKQKVILYEINDAEIMEGEAENKNLHEEISKEGRATGDKKMPVPFAPLPTTAIPATATAEATDLTPDEISATLYFKFSKYFREEITSPKAKSLFVISPLGAVKVMGDRIISESEDRFDIYKDILLVHKPKQLLKKLLLNGVDVETYSLGRWNGKIVYIIGARYPDESKPQVWIDKETFLPIRWIITRWVPGNEKQGLEIRYEDWQTLYRQGKKKRRVGAFPGKILFLKKGQTYEERLTENIIVNPFFNDRIFDVSHIKASYLPEDTRTDKDTNNPDMKEIKKLIQDFQKRYKKDE